MLIIQYDDDGNNSTVHKVSAVDIKQETAGNDDVLLITAVSGDRTVEIRIWTDLNATARQGADRIAQAVEKDIYISPYEERSYLFLNTTVEPGDDQIKVSGNITKTILDK